MILKKSFNSEINRKLILLLFRPSFDFSEKPFPDNSKLKRGKGKVKFFEASYRITVKQ